VGGVVGAGVSPLVNTQFQYLDVGVNVEITPKIHDNGEVSLTIDIDISSVTGQVNLGGINEPIIGQRKIHEDVRLREGDVSLLGGLLNVQDSTVKSGVPGLANIPIIGNLFKGTNVDRERDEIMIALVPHVVRRPDITPENLRGIDSGQTNTIQVRRGPRPIEPDLQMPPGDAPMAAAGDTAPSTVNKPAVPPAPGAAPAGVPLMTPGIATALPTGPSAIVSPAAPPAPGATPAGAAPMTQGIMTPGIATAPPATGPSAIVYPAAPPAPGAAPAGVAIMTPGTAPPATAPLPAALLGLVPPATAPPEGSSGAPGSAPPAGLVKIRFNEAQLDRNVGDNISVSILVDNAKDVVSAPFTLQYDPKILSLNEVVYGKFWSTDGEEPIMIKNVQNDAGTASIRLNRKPGSPAVAGTGTLLTLNFKAVGPGTATVAASNITLNNAQNQLVGSGSSRVTINVK
jgi:general secretion pathway protein D